MLKHHLTTHEHKINCYQEPIESVYSNKQALNKLDRLDDDMMITNTTSIIELLNLPKTVIKQLYCPDQFKVRVPVAYLKKIKQQDIDDPLLRQILPFFDEKNQVADYSTDPLGEKKANITDGLLHKYHSRVLIILTSACAIHCRYCFRQHFDYQSNHPKAEQWQVIGQYISNHPDVNEVILSGGDPLSLNNRRLFAVIEHIEQLTQITTLRLHSRHAIVLAQRFDDELIQRLSNSRLNIVLVTHANHANEIDALVISKMQTLRQQGITLLNQSVLLKGINDDIDTLKALSEKLFQAHILPYYLHLLDKVAGAAHFYICEKRAIELYWQLLAALPGYLVPKLVKEEAGQPFKTPIDLYEKID